MHNVTMRYLGILAFEDTEQPTEDGLRYERIRKSLIGDLLPEDHAWYIRFITALAAGRVKTKEIRSTPIMVMDESGNISQLRKFPPVPSGEKHALGKYRFRFTGEYMPTRYFRFEEFGGKKKVKKAVGKPIYYPVFTCEVSQDDRRNLETGFLDHNVRVFLYEMVGMKDKTIPESEVLEAVANFKPEPESGE